jgi:hypothetical protein
MKHAKNLFAEAVSQLIEMGEKQRKLLQDKEKAVDHSDREAIPQIRAKEKRAHVRLTEREKLQLHFNFN